MTLAVGMRKSHYLDCPCNNSCSLVRLLNSLWWKQNARLPLLLDSRTLSVYKAVYLLLNISYREQTNPSFLSFILFFFPTNSQPPTFFSYLLNLG